MKLDKYIASTGYCSRRKALVLIEEKRVRLNGKLASIFIPVKEGDEIKIDDVVLKKEKIEPVFIAYHKPKGIISTSEKIENNIIDAVNHPQRIYPVGRLDKDSEGLILLTNQSLLIDQIANPAGNHEKEYVVTLNHPVRKQFLDDISAGIKIGSEQTKPCIATIEAGSKRILRIILKQGLNRQIRRMCNAYQYQVIKLQRVRVMNIELGKLKAGEWRNLNENELKHLFEALNLQKPKLETKQPKEKPKEYIKTGVFTEKIVSASIPKQKLAKAKLKKHEIKAQKKEPWKKMYSEKAKGLHPAKELKNKPDKVKKKRFNKLGLYKADKGD